MKTILFFDRCDLTRLYILLTKKIEGKVNVIHVSFSDKESKILEKEGITDYIDYQKELSRLVDNLSPSDELIDEIDHLIISQSKGNFTLNGSIQSDRGYTLLSYDEALLLACCHYTIWKDIFRKYHVDIMYHEPASLFMNHIAALLCKSQGGEYIYMTQLYGEDDGYFYLNIDGENFSCKDLENNYNYYKNHIEEIDRKRCERFVDKYRASYVIAFNNLNTPIEPKWKLCLSAVKHDVSVFVNKKNYDRLKNNIDYWMLHNKKALMRLNNLRQYKKRKIVFSQPVEGERYFYYSIHMEPEATVLYLSGGLYTNQIKLIENIAASLPPGYYLYVKDHPHEFAYRKADDYERLMKVPNIRLIDQNIPGKLLVKDAAGIFTINGTVGFEGLIMGKRVFCFGKSYYTISPRINFILNVRDVRDVVYRTLNIDNPEDDDFYAFVYAYLVTIHKGFVAYFGDLDEKAKIEVEQNVEIISEEILKKCLK